RANASVCACSSPRRFCLRWRQTILDGLSCWLFSFHSVTDSRSLKSKLNRGECCLACAGGHGADFRGTPVTARTERSRPWHNLRVVVVREHHDLGVDHGTVGGDEHEQKLILWNATCRARNLNRVARYDCAVHGADDGTLRAAAAGAAKRRGGRSAGVGSQRNADPREQQVLSLCILADDAYFGGARVWPGGHGCRPRNLVDVVRVLQCNELAVEYAALRVGQHERELIPRQPDDDTADLKHTTGNHAALNRAGDDCAFAGGRGRDRVWRRQQRVVG